MFSTKSAQSLRNLFAGYHEPAGLSKQQSQKLLEGLKTSFRQHLEREYGRTPGRPAAVASAQSRASDAHDQIRHSAASQHLKSVLSNPLFSYNNNSKRTDFGSQTTATAVARRDPMDVFDHAVAKGMMTLKAATGCLTAKRQMLSGADVASSQTAARVLRWLKHGGLEADLRFLDDRLFVGALVPLLIAEGLENVAWEWLSRTVGEAQPSWSADVRSDRTNRLLIQFVHAQSQPESRNLDAAFTTFLHAEQLLQSSPSFQKCLVKAWRLVSWLSTVGSFSRPAPSEKLFDAHVATVQVLPPALDIETAHLHLRHPTKPNLAPALHLFHDKSRLQGVIQRLPRRSSHNANPEAAVFEGFDPIRWLAFLGQDTISHLRRLGREKEADSVMALLRFKLTKTWPNPA